MTISDSMYEKLANVSAQLGKERSLCDRLKIDNQILREDYAILRQRYNDLKLDFAQYKERYHVR